MPKYGNNNTLYIISAWRWNFQSYIVWRNLHIVLVNKWFDFKIYFLPLVILRKNLLLICKTLITFRGKRDFCRRNTVIFRTNPVIIRTNPSNSRTNPVILRKNPVLFKRKHSCSWTNSVVIWTKLSYLLTIQQYLLKSKLHMGQIQSCLKQIYSHEGPIQPYLWSMDCFCWIYNGKVFFPLA